MNHEIAATVLRAPGSYTDAVVSDARWYAAEVLEGQVALASKTVTVAEVDPALWVPRNVADGLYHSVLVLLQLVDDQPWLNLSGVDIRTQEVFIRVKLAMLNSILGQLNKAGTLRPVIANPEETDMVAAARLYTEDSPEYFVAVSAAYIRLHLSPTEAANDASQG